MTRGHNRLYEGVVVTVSSPKWPIYIIDDGGWPTKVLRDSDLMDAWEINYWVEIVDAYDSVGNRLSLHGVPIATTKEIEQRPEEFHPFVSVASMDKQHFEAVARRALTSNARKRRRFFRRAHKPDDTFERMPFPQLLAKFIESF